MPRLVVADDDPMVGQTIEVSFQRQSRDVTLAYAGETEFAAREALPFEMKPLHVHMPQMSGVDIIRCRSHQRAPEIPVVARMSRRARRHATSACLTATVGDLPSPDRKEVP